MAPPSIVPPPPGPPPTSQLPPTPTEKAAAALAAANAYTWIPPSSLSLSPTSSTASLLTSSQPPLPSTQGVPALPPIPAVVTAAYSSPNLRSPSSPTATSSPTSTISTTGPATPTFSTTPMAMSIDTDVTVGNKQSTPVASPTSPTAPPAYGSHNYSQPSRRPMSTSVPKRFHTGIGGHGNVARSTDPSNGHASDKGHHAVIHAERAVLVPMALVGVAPGGVGHAQKRCGIGGAGNVVRHRRKSLDGEDRNGDRSIWVRLSGKFGKRP